MIPGSAPGGRPEPVLHVHATRYAYTGDANTSAPGGMTLIYKDLIADQDRNGRSPPTSPPPSPGAGTASC